MLCVAAVVSGCTEPAAPPNPAPSDDASFSLLAPADFHTLDRITAFDKLTERVATDYALTAWKQLDLEALSRSVRPQVAKAQADNSPAEYLLALRHYAAGFSDGHVRVAETAASSLISPGPLATALIRSQSGGSFGLSLTGTDDGRIIVASLATGGAAQRAGIHAGDEVISWNGTDASDAVAAVDLGSLAASMPVATSEYRWLEQIRLLTRAPIGTRIVLRVRAAHRSRTVHLTASDDRGTGLEQFDLAQPLTAQQEKTFVPTTRQLGEDIGYVQLGWLADLSDVSGYPQAIAEAFSAAVAKDVHAAGLVIDLRGNHGGSDQLAADLCGHFTTNSRFYERTQFFNATTKAWTTLTVDGRSGEAIDALMVSPQPVQYRGPVAVLINPRTVSSGEGLARCIATSGAATTVGFNGTRGSFAVASGEIPMPDGLVFHYPNGRSVDSAGQVQLDSRQGVGGANPGVRVPSRPTELLAFAAGTDVELAAAVQWLHQHRGESR